MLSKLFPSRTSDVICSTMQPRDTVQIIMVDGLEYFTDVVRSAPVPVLLDKVFGRYLGMVVDH